METLTIVSLALGLCFMVFERIYPARPLPIVSGWWLRVILINSFQAAVVLVTGMYLRSDLFPTPVLNTSPLGDWPSAWIAYFVVTFVFYWWHRWRHRVYFLWIAMHQIHHSAQRIETITSFYKHPLEIAINSLIISSISYGLLGMTVHAAAILSFLTCIAEFMYHVNIKTPYWWGFIFQRPESHRIHHQLGKHDKNFADLPLWDILFGTFDNPKREVSCGFLPKREAKFLAMLLFRDVNVPPRRDSA